MKKLSQITRVLGVFPDGNVRDVVLREDRVEVVYALTGRDRNFAYAVSLDDAIMETNPETIRSLIAFRLAKAEAGL